MWGKGLNQGMGGVGDGSEDGFADRIEREVDVKVIEKAGCTIPIIVLGGDKRRDRNDDDSKGPWGGPGNGSYTGIDNKGDVPLTMVAIIPEDGMYEVNIAGVTKVNDSGASASLACTLSYTEVGSGAATTAITLNLVAGPAPNSATVVVMLVKGSIVTLQTGTSGLTVGSYDLFASVQHLA